MSDESVTSALPASDRIEEHKAIVQALQDRQTWANRITTYYQMRRKGLPRQNSPWPGAADLHLPLIDDVITGKAPFFASQLFGAERIASFSPVADAGIPAQAEAAGKLAELFDDEVKVASNLFAQILVANDTMMEAGKGILMTRWDAEKGLTFEAVAPLSFVVPRHATQLQDSPWVVRIVTLTCESYRALGYNAETLPLIKGNAGSVDSASETDKKTRALGEGIATAREDEVILWERYSKHRDEKGNVSVKVCVFSPLHPTLNVRADFTLPDYHEVTETGATVTHYPFTDLPNEMLETGFYSSRGDAEKLAAFEAWACRQWNAKGDHMSISTKPIFKGGREGNLTNFRFFPGAILEGDVQPVTFPPPPYDLDEEIDRTRSHAERRSRLPDFSLGSRDNLSGNKTATEVNALTQFASAGVDLMANVYRLQVTALLRQAWGLLVHRKAARVAQALGGAALTAQKILKAFRVTVSGSVDSWNKNLQHQRAVTLWNAFKNDPMINQVELRKLFLESLDTRLVDRLLVDPKIKGTDEAEDEAMEIVLMLHGFPAVPTEAEDHAGRARLITGKLQAKAIEAAEDAITGEQEGKVETAQDARAVQLLIQHRQMHLDMLKKQNPQAFAQAVQEIKQAEAQTVQLIGQMQQQAQMQAQQQAQQQQMRREQIMDPLRQPTAPAPTPAFA